MVIDTGQLPIFDAADVVVVGTGSRYGCGSGSSRATNTPPALYTGTTGSLAVGGSLASRSESLEGRKEWQAIKTTCC